MKPFLYLLSVALLTGCATLSEDQCRGGDWGSIGYRDGSNGRPPAFLSNHAEACAEYGIRPDPALWERGRQKGLTEVYCTPATAFDQGRRGRILQPVCVGDTSALVRANRQGLRLRLIEQEMAEIERDIRSINAELSDLPGDSPDRGRLLAHRARLRLDLLSLRTDRLRYL